MATESNRVYETREVVRLMAAGEGPAPFVPWAAGEQGQQAFLKMTKDDDTAFLYAGMGGIVDVDIQKALMRLVNDGWSVQGEVHLSFDGTGDPGADGYPEVDAIVLEIGSGLLPLVDPYQNAPLLEKLRDIRREVGQDIGFVAPGVKVRDDMALPPSAYRIVLRDAPAAQGEIFLDRFLAVGSLEQLAPLQGWSTVDPSYRMPAKWIPVEAREAAESAGCMLFGGLSVLLTHLREVVKRFASELLGLQETHALVARLAATHPVVVEDIVQSTARLRKVRHVLQRLLDENVSIGNLVTILETIGDHLADLDDAEAMAERVRRSLARQIATRCLDEEGALRGLVLSDEAEGLLADRLKQPLDALSDDGGFTRIVREALEEHGMPPVLFTPPALRPGARRLLRDSLVVLTVLSTAEIRPGLRVQVAGAVKAPKKAAPVEPPPPDGADAGFWKTRKKSKP